MRFFNLSYVNFMQFGQIALSTDSLQANIKNIYIKKDYVSAGFIFDINCNVPTSSIFGEILFSNITVIMDSYDSWMNNINSIILF